MSVWLQLLGSKIVNQETDPSSKPYGFMVEFMYLSSFKSVQNVYHALYMYTEILYEFPDAFLSSRWKF